MLRHLIAAFDDVYVVVDSLDECGDRVELLKWIQAVAGWNSARPHLLVTSRLEPNITSRLKLIRNIQLVNLRGSALENDIIIYIDERLSLINNWSEAIRQMVKTTLIAGADGM